MRLVFTPNPNYIHKVLVVAHEAGIDARLEFERQVPFDDDTAIWRSNPLGKVPTLVLDDGSSLYGGQLICEYLDSLRTAGTSLFPTGASGWLARRQFCTGDGLFDATTNLRVEGWRPAAQRSEEAMRREPRKILGALAQMELDAQAFAAGPLHIGQVGFAGGLSYLEHRNPVREHRLEPGDAQFEWRAGRPALAAWYQSIQCRPSIRFRLEWDPATRTVRPAPAPH